MPIYLAPDIYIEEVSGGARPIQAVGTSTAGFVGVAPNATARVNEAVAINNWSQFVREFIPEGSASTALSHAVYGFFQNGGSRCYVVNVGADQPISGGGRKRAGLDVLEEIDEVAIVAAPGYTDVVSYEAVISHCEKMRDRVGLLDAPENVANIGALTQVAAPPTPPKKSAKAEEEKPAGGEAVGTSGLRPRQSDGGYAAFYFPWIVVRDPLSSNDLVSVPPSGHLAGVWARSDATRGVHKAPANEPIRGALSLTYNLTRAEQGELNQNGVNCIRFFANEGIRVWGARTVASGSSEWRYLNVRRLFNMIEESIANSTRWIVFEPNDRPLWKAIRRDVGAFLTLLWRDGALMGQTPEEAFFVKCDEETNPQENIDAGIVVTLIGIAPVKPAEFIVFRISQYASGTDVEVQGG
ncbi:MAG: phage tail sheath subtilisin-like domain-containing protein [Chloroflexi bacterium]|nr:phage tail sheath subtilisin-like domain-containing protein [Chloroflexota bacterium]MCI0580777.1 phage tail sheath subtilisin-like domain-containing protein [Chloroflexota bacterium]MCI0648700.1 phage tail sheath subtilisin-like domain-containing protein [Chloroflexota bacterium]MCI0731503.1 phage tail sheath subtilisin-like domain-containing protein [Chloroflexota bacterium]